LPDSGQELVSAVLLKPFSVDALVDAVQRAMGTTLPTT
jgi:hypothetical protein